MKTIALSSVSLLAVLCAAVPARAQCPKITLSVDNDIKGSGYSEVKPKNWVSSPVGSCNKNYRYLSHTVGDGTRKGKAIWQPKITVTGWYQVTTSYRATTNRTTDADYVLYDDNGGTRRPRRTASRPPATARRPRPTPKRPPATAPPVQTAAATARSLPAVTARSAAVARRGGCWRLWRCSGGDAGGSDQSGLTR